MEMRYYIIIINMQRVKGGASLVSLSNKQNNSREWLEREREMLDNPQALAQAQGQGSQSTESPTVVKRYAPPNQRNRSSNRRKSSDRLDRTNSAGSDLEKNQIALSRNVQVPDQGDAGGYNLLNDNHYSAFVALEGCSCSAASQLHNDRWSAAIQSYNNPKDSSEKPIMYSGGTSSVWTQFKLPHQIMTPAAGASSSVPQLDFLTELRRQIHSTNTSFST